MLLDEVLPDGSGLRLLDVAFERNLLMPTLLTTAFLNRETANRAFSLGAYYCEKPADPDMLKRFAAEVRVPGTLKVMRGLSVWASRYNLTSAESRVLRLAAFGYSHDEIALRCQVAKETVKTHVRGLLSKTQDDSLARAALRLLREP